MRPERVSRERTGDSTVKPEDESLKLLNSHEVPGITYKVRLDNLEPGDEPGQVPLRDEDRVEGEGRMKVKDSNSCGPLLHELPHHVGEQVGQMIYLEMFLPAPLLAEEVLANCLHLSRLAEIAGTDPVKVSGISVRSKIPGLQNLHHGGEVQLELL